MKFDHKTALCTILDFGYDWITSDDMFIPVVYSFEAIVKLGFV